MDMRLPSPINELADDRLAAVGVRVLLNRGDLIGSEVPGNRFRKLR
ncbi:hypothetical protein CLV63_1296 [Murinocardiopsis flavida]|uniref:Uncharacterized protein n=1 Tax=Murinocardiopsis flavida TaxID=645275 RepID=A0A2P8CUT1_9ACTN|nr:hypothetical protein [Murinocardiopsis flavida]PSK88720.1 hypothetical protein CLV63_1296 [Murinocardiopsis flavida]